MKKILATYVWLDGDTPQGFRSKIKVIDAVTAASGGVTRVLAENPEKYRWQFDGSSTNQATGEKSDLLIQPVFHIHDPFTAGEDNVIFLCEVLNADGTPHRSNTRRALIELLEKRPGSKTAWFGMEQEYNQLQRNGRPLGFPQEGYPAPQGKYYCGVGANHIFGRNLSDAHLELCLKLGLHIEGTNAEVMPGQWEFQIGAIPAPLVADELLMARYLLQRLGEDYDTVITFDAKPEKGDWNGAGCHTNFSTEEMREGDGAWDAINVAAARIGAHELGSDGKTDPQKVLDICGPGTEHRLTGKHETCSYKEFRAGVGDRGAAIRVSAQVEKAKRGYLEYRRPSANCDPYKICLFLLEATVDQ